MFKLNHFKTNCSKIISIVILACLIIWWNGGEIENKKTNINLNSRNTYIGMIEEMNKELMIKVAIQKKKEIDERNISRGGDVQREEEKREVKNEQNKGQLFVVTAYDLSYNSCGKYPSDYGYGITKNGTNLRGKTWLEARVISTDQRVIPINSKVYIEFLDDNYKRYNGYYFASDVGGGIRGRHVDFFIGDFHSSKPSQEALEFGRTEAYIKIIE